MNSKRCRLSLKEIATWTGFVILLIDKVARRTAHRVTVVLAVRITRGNTKENKFEGLWMRMFIYLVSNVRRRKKTFWVPIRLPDLTPWSLSHRDSLMSHANAIRSMHMRHASCLELRYCYIESLQDRDKKNKWKSTFNFHLHGTNVSWIHTTTWKNRTFGAYL